MSLSLERILMLPILVFIYFVITPFYIFKSGGIQPSHGVLIILFFYYFIVEKKLTFRLDSYARRVFTYFTYFIGYVYLVNSVVSINSNSILPLKYSSYYLFNFLVFIVFYDILSKKEDYPRLIFYFLLITLFLQVALLVAGYGRNWHGGQQMLFFNNPNQLGYYSLLASSLIILIGWSRKYSPVLIIFGSLIGAFLSVSASSIAALIGTVSGLTIYLVSLIKYKKKNTIILVLIMLFVSLFSGLTIYEDINSIEIISRVESKFTSKTTRQGGWSEGRGYDTIFQYPEYLLLGMGELPGRFKNEFHSTLGNVLRSYGVVGIMLLGMVGVLVFIRAPIFAFYLFIPILIYGLAHNGIRQPFLWIYLAFVFTLRRQNQYLSLTRRTGG